ncbi:MAG: 50S ribosomal protein L3 [Rickettsiales bacterium]|nr:50S ribosomal protein L3 [Rickettsiales bacterium]
MRSGLIAKKVGMTRIFEGSDRQIPVTVLQIDNVRVVNTKNMDKDGYQAVCLGYGEKKEKNVTKPVAGLYKKAGLKPALKMVEFRVSPDCMLEVGTQLSPNHFIKGQFVDVIGTTIGKGYAGPMKRWNFGGLEASHGVKKAHRSHGSTGTRQSGGTTIKGKKMAGHLGDERVTVQNLEVVEIDMENGLLIVKGAVPGHKGAFVLIKDAVKKELPQGVPFPAGIVEGSKKAAKVEDEPVQETVVAQPEQSEVAVEGQGE